MNWVMVGFVVAAIVIYSLVYLTNPKNVKTAFNATIYQLFHPSEGFMYLIIAAFFISSMLILILPKEQIVSWIGRESGWKGLTIGAGLGAVTPGGPFLTFPILVAFTQSGAGVGAIISYLTSWSLLGVHRVLAWEVPFLGWKFVLVRLAVSLLVPIVLGFLGQWLYDALRLE
ncbi:MAG: permease [Candidatus Aenigmarchaeota archaeon]|nr:permease [Candidatus Aenigmarchaeota archaeon]